MSTKQASATNQSRPGPSSLASDEDIQLAQAYLRGRYGKPRDLFDLARRLKKAKAFGYARKLLALVRQDPELDTTPDLKLRVLQQHALCTYKDPDLLVDEKLDRALEILQEGFDLRTTTDQETLGLAGAIHKRKWEADGRTQHLERGLSYYLRGHRLGADRDYGYTGINAAYVLDLLADQQSQELEEPRSGFDLREQRRVQANQIRQELIELLPGLPANPSTQFLEEEWWFLATIAEAYFGLERYDDARIWLRKAAALDVAEWEYESTARQLASIARLKASGSGSAAELEQSEAWDALREFLGNNAAGVRTAFIGKVGLALSGGGFRASLFHIGVLARLAELDILRHVEVLSCVSGGSIIGAYYYLQVRQLLQVKPDGSLTRDDYVELVKALERDFLTGVQKNLRTRVAASFWKNLKILFAPGYTRTNRLGELFEEELYSRLLDDEGGPPLWMDALRIHPKNEPASFEPKLHNWRRHAKVPILILNATTLNTGHVWQFTASWMGEPPGAIDTEVDGNRRLRRMYYRDAPAPHQRIRLGHAVAASACVPSLFTPLMLKELYPGMTVRLVDGGVHDNQGVQGLLEQGCSIQLVSDGSGQMQTQCAPGANILAVPLRSNSILMARVREAQFRDLEGRRRTSLLQDLVFVHLKKDLDEDPVDWVDCQDPYEASDDARPQSRRGPLTRYGIRKDVQARLADIRTDLDSFTEVEAYALMASGYRMISHELDRRLDLPPADSSRASAWRFLELEPMLGQNVTTALAHQDLMRQLAVANQRVLKLFRLSPLLSRAIQGLATILLLALLGLAGWFILSRWDQPLLQLSVRQLVLGLFLVGSAAVLALAGFGWVLAWVHLRLFDKLYLHRGSLARLLEHGSLRAARPKKPEVRHAA